MLLPPQTLRPAFRFVLQEKFSVAAFNATAHFRIMLVASLLTAECPAITFVPPPPKSASLALLLGGFRSSRHRKIRHHGRKRDAPCAHTHGLGT